MGLDINTYGKGKKEIGGGRMGSYGAIHILRDWVLINVEGNSEDLVKQAHRYGSKEANEAWDKLVIEKCPCLINHSDCDGGYIDTKHYKKKATWEWNSLTDLVRELSMLKKDFYNAMGEDERAILDRFIGFIPEGAVKVEFT